ncbi:mg chelatase subunit ChlI [Clostridium sp. CAG:575]|nr:mg chelatase subunit ChlI [Clostridium sp. CAG:575]
MLAITKSMALHGLKGYIISIQVDISAGMPYFEIVGLADTSIKESKERIRTAIKNLHIEFLSRRIVVNLAPANIRKEGSSLDLAIAVGILIASQNINYLSQSTLLKDTILIGELSLDGKIEKVNGILPICIEAQKQGIKRIILPKENAKEAAYVKNIEVLPVENLEEVIRYLNQEIEISKEKNKNFLEEENIYNVDFSEVKGQENVKRALEVSAAGGHNCLMIRESRIREDYACKKVTKHFT